MVLGIDLGGTKLATAIFSSEGTSGQKEVVALEGRSGRQVGALIAERVKECIRKTPVKAVGISVPGISRVSTGRVWAPNIPGWDDYPLVMEIRRAAGDIPVAMDSDRACSILGEVWKGNARGCDNAVFLAVGTGIGAGVLTGGQILRGASDIAGAVGWMALDKPFQDKYIACGCFEYYASGDGIAKFAREVLALRGDYQGMLKGTDPERLTARDVFGAYENGDAVAETILDEVIRYWGMAAANMVSIFNPEKVIFGGGVFGPAVKFIARIRQEASKWAQPISMQQAVFEASALGPDAAIYGAAHIALNKLSNPL